MYCLKKDSSWNEGMVARQGSSTAAFLGCGTIITLGAAARREQLLVARDFRFD
jgi:hypothetical protein